MAIADETTGLTKWTPKELSQELIKYLPEIEQLLPEVQRGKAEWFVKRAMLTVSTSEQASKIQKCSPKSIIMAIIKGAELGIPIDGKLGYFVPFWNKHRGCFEAKFMASYLGLLMVAKRSGQIADGFPAMVYRNDQFEHGRIGDECILKHTWDFGLPRGKQIGAYCVVKFNDGTWTYETMDMAELAAIRRRSKAADDGPWKTDEEQMFIKTVVRRALKRYCSDPGFIAAIQHDEEEFIDREPKRRISRSDINDLLPGLEHEPDEPHDTPRIEQHDEPDEVPSLQATEAEQVDDLVSAIAAAVANGDLATVKAIDDIHCGPESRLSSDSLDIVASAVRDAKAKIGTKPKAKQTQAFDKSPHA